MGKTEKYELIAKSNDFLFVSDAERRGILTNLKSDVGSDPTLRTALSI